MSVIVRTGAMPEGCGQLRVARVDHEDMTVVFVNEAVTDPVEQRSLVARALSEAVPL